MQKSESHSLEGNLPSEWKEQVSQNVYSLGEFPFIIFKTPTFVMMKIPIHFNRRNEESKLEGIHVQSIHASGSHLSILENQPLQEELIQLTRRLQKKMSIDFKHDVRLCLVLGEKDCIYFRQNEEMRSSRIPIPTTLIGVRGQVLSMLEIEN